MIDEAIRAAMHRDMAYRAAEEVIVAARAELRTVEGQLSGEEGAVLTRRRARGPWAGRPDRSTLESRRDALVEQVRFAEESQRLIAREAEQARLHAFRG